MANGSRIFSSRPYGIFPQGVKWLLISNTALFVLYYFSVLTGHQNIFEPFGLVPADVVRRLSVWQLVTYMFLHDPFSFSHILFNMLTLWMFGADLERTWGRQAFLKYYFLCGIGAGLCVVLANVLFSDNWNTRTIGASGAIYGLLFAFGYLYPDREILFSFLFPIKAKYFVMIIGAIAFLSSFGGSGGGISHIAHLGGMVIGYFYLRSLQKSRRPAYARASFGDSVRARYKDWKVQRAKRKFEVYMRQRERERDRDRFVH
jgi:membrane associated rhomboid family serine protease